ncbi:MAG: phosphoglucosamine mutase, partial [Candidatus Cloacimonetes bacterium]|nr:phosphoglucosamine mutase [Candidatus Cloacimonadota bacterium]
VYHSVVAGLLSVGCEVVNLGIVSTPTTLLAVEESDADGGLSITASHNPAEWNALKLVNKNGMFLFPEDAERFISTLDEPIEYCKWDEVRGVSEDFEASWRHIQKVLSIPYLNLEKIRAKKFKVILDSVNGAGGVISPALLKELDCEVIELNTEPTGHFAHTPEPLNKNLTQLEAAVKEHKADIGFATDPDVDRLALVDEKGNCIGEEFSILLSEKYILAKNKGDIVINLSSSMASEDIAAQYGVKVHRTRVGEINVGKKMKEIKSPIGGEGNGGIIVPEVHYTRDAPVGMAIILGLMAEDERPLSEIVNDIPHYYFAKGKLEIPADKLDAVMQNAEKVYADYEKDTQDGLKILGNKFWIHIRKSGTEPIIRVYVESETQEKSDMLCQETMTKITAGII